MEAKSDCRSNQILHGRGCFSRGTIVMVFATCNEEMALYYSSRRAQRVNEAPVSVTTLSLILRATTMKLGIPQID